MRQKFCLGSEWELPRTLATYPSRKNRLDSVRSYLGCGLQLSEFGGENVEVVLYLWEFNSTWMWEWCLNITQSFIKTSHFKVLLLSDIFIACQKLIKSHYSLSLNFRFCFLEISHHQWPGSLINIHTHHMNHYVNLIFVPSKGHPKSSLFNIISTSFTFQNSSPI